MASGIRLTNPCPSGRLTDAFGWRAAIPGVMPAQLHTGQDWAAPQGTPILAMHSGRVNRVWWDTFANGNPAGGNMLQIGSALVSSRYAHMSRYAVNLGAEVRAGQVIGYVGTTGASTGSHLHGELLIGGQFVDPMPYLRSTPAPPPPPPPPEEEDDDMAKTSGFSYTTITNGKTSTVYLILNPASGFYSEYSNGPGNGPMAGSYNNPIAATFDTGSYAKITEGHARALKASCERVLARE